MAAVLWITASVIFTSIIILLRSRLPHPNSPPGPPPEILLGHARIIPEKHTDDFFYELSKIYGKIISLWMPGQNLLILNSTKVAVDLLDKRSAIYSDRPASQVIRLMGWIVDLVFFPYGKDFRRHRRLLNEYLNQKKCLSYEHIQEFEARRAVQSFASDPERFVDHLNRFSAAIILRVVHGHEIQTDDDPYLSITEDVGYAIAHCAPPLSNSVDLFPFLRHLPSWFPGTYPATQARGFKKYVDKMHEYPFADIQRQMANGTEKDCFISTHLKGLQREGENYPYSAEDIKGAAAVSYNAGADTTFSTLYTFILAMVLYPATQTEVQDEIDLIVGHDRLPRFGDRQILPNLERLVQETYRWHNAVPSGIPHRCMEDNIYEGMFIPKGSVVIANIRGMMLDEDVYQNPRIFDPSRYLRGEPYPSAQFGFGRRICPGRHLAEGSVWITIASILASFTISPTLDELGKPVIPPEEFEFGITSHPKKFSCKITPRREINTLS